VTLGQQRCCSVRVRLEPRDSGAALRRGAVDR
jgi:hypothetical protein